MYRYVFIRGILLEPNILYNCVFYFVCTVEIKYNETLQDFSLCVGVQLLS